jgi:hypothetical protein
MSLTTELSNMTLCHSDAEPQFGLSVKNTFIEFVESPASHATERRCTSLPPAWRQPVVWRSTIGYSCKQPEACLDLAVAPSEASTDDIEDSSDDGASSAETVETPNKVTLCLDNVVCNIPEAMAKEAPRTKLVSNATAFEPAARSHRGELRELLAAVRAALLKLSFVAEVMMHEAHTGDATQISLKVPWGMQGRVATALSLAKAALLETAGYSECVYVLGYAARPFVEMGDGSFGAWLGCLPAAHANMVCWDTYTKGACPRRSSCRWCHPTPADLMQVFVTVETCAASPGDHEHDTVVLSSADMSAEICWACQA